QQRQTVEKPLFLLYLAALAAVGLETLGESTSALLFLTSEQDPYEQCQGGAGTDRRQQHECLGRGRKAALLHERVRFGEDLGGADQRYGGRGDEAAHLGGGR